MTDIYEYGNKIKKEIDKFLETAGVESFELTNEIKRAKEKDADFRAWAGDKEGWYEFISDAKDIEAINRLKDSYFKVINSISKDKREEKLYEEKKNTQWWKENSNYWAESNNWWKKYKNGELDWQKDQKKREEENNKKLEESERNWKNEEKKRDEEWKKKFIGDIEMDLVKKKITDESLNKRLGVSDWREKINGAVDFYEALSRRSDLWDIIRDLGNEFTCANCGTTKSSYFPYERKGKKYCSYECEKEDRQAGRIEVSDISKIVKAFQDWMKKHSIEKISYSANGELVIQFSGQTAKVVEESKLTGEQKEIKSFFKANPQQAREIVANQEYRDNSFTPEKTKSGVLSKMSGGEIAVTGLVIAGVVALIITLIVKLSSKRNQ